MINFLSLFKKTDVKISSFFFFPGEILPNFDSEKNDFDLLKGFLMEKKNPNSPDFEEFFFKIARFL
jgi:hypothetical protein